jgi:hypothetical protein
MRLIVINIQIRILVRLNFITSKQEKCHLNKFGVKVGRGKRWLGRGEDRGSLLGVWWCWAKPGNEMSLFSKLTEIPPRTF